MNERDIFTAALEQPGDDARCAFLDEACADDASLRERIDLLLNERAKLGSFMECPAVDVMTHVAGDSGTNPYVPAISLDFLEESDRADSLGRLGQYEILETVGRGGMGVVLKARDTNLNRVVAVKVLAPELAANATARRRFSREAEAAAAVSHDHVVTIYAVEQNECPGRSERPGHLPLPYLVMEYIDGLSLQEKIDRQGPLELKEVLRIGRQIAAGLSAAHDQGLIHRDVKPSNILLQNGVQRVQITDFGLARAVDDVGMTKTGEITGTPQYMSPEQAQGHPVDARSDLFSLGSVLYAMCTGRSPFRAETSVATLRSVCDDLPPPLCEMNPDIPEWLIAVIDKLLAKNPVERFQSAEEVAQLLEQYSAHLQDPATIPEPPRPSAIGSRRQRARGTWRRTSIVIACLLIALLGGFTVLRVLQLGAVEREPVVEETRNRDPQHQLVWTHLLLSEVMSVSPDGRHVAFFDTESSDLAVHDLNTDEDRRLTSARGPDGRFYTSEAVFSSDGQWLAYNWINEKDECGLHIFKLDGTDSRQILAPEEGRWVDPRGWTPDGREILCTFKSGNSARIAFIAADDGTIREVKSLELPSDGNLVTMLSPDGRYVAYQRPAGDEAGETEPSVSVLSADGRSENSVRGVGAVLGWAPDAERLLVRMNQAEFNRVALIRMKDGQPKGRPQQIRDGAGSRLLTAGQFTPDGAFYYVRSASPEPDELWVVRNFLPAYEPGQRVVWSAPELAGVVSVAADESLLAFCDADTGDLVVRSLKDGTVRRLSENTVAWESYPESVLVSPDGRLVACDWRSENGQKSDLRVFPTDGGAPRVVYTPDGEDVRRAVLQDWSPDGRQLLVRLVVGDVEEHLTRIALISLNDDAPQILQSLPYRPGFNSAANLKFSPDGRFIAYETLPGEQARNSDIALMSVDGNPVSVLIEDDADDDLVDWLPDGSGVVFQRWQRNNKSETWLIRIENGRPQGEPQRIASGLGFGEFAADGTFYDVASAGEVQDVWLATLDLVSGAVLKKPAPASAQFPGHTRGAAWSPDGRSLAYYVNSPDWSIVIRSADGAERVIALPQGFMSGMLHWSPDGKTLLFDSFSRRMGVYRINVETGEVTNVEEQGNGVHPCQLGWSNDGSEVILCRAPNFSKNGEPITQQFLRLNIESGATTPIYKQPLEQINGLFIDGMVSPDGSQLAVLHRTLDSRTGALSLFTIPTAGGEPQTLYETSRDQTGRNAGRCLDWTPDGKSLVVSLQTRRRVGRGAPLLELCRISAPGSDTDAVEPEPLGFAASGLWNLDIHPNSGQIAYTRWQRMYHIRATEGLPDDDP